MLRLARGLISNGYLVGSHMSSPKFYSPTHSQSEMLGHIQDIEGNLGHGNEGEGGVDQHESLCERWEREPVEPLLLLVQVTVINFGSGRMVL